jgi:O-antigen ligase
MLPIAIYELLRARRNTLPYAVMIGTMYASVIAGASRAASVLCTTAALIAVPLMMLRYRLNRNGIATMLLGVFALTGVFAWIVGPQVVWERLTASGKYELRREFLLASVTMFREHPWHGFGIGTWATVYPQYALIDPGSFANEAHNEWAQWAVEGGIPLLGIMLSVAGWVLWKVFRSPWAFGLVLVLIHSWVEYPFERQALAGWLAAILGLLAVYGTEQS